MKGKPSAGIPFASHQGTGLFTAQGRCSHISAKRKRRHFVVFTLTQRKGMCEGETICGFPLRVPSGYRLIHCTGRVFPYLRQKKKTPIGVFFFWRRWRDLNPRGTFAPYSLSRGAPSPLGYISKGYELLSEVLAERMGFEPMALSSHRFSRPAP